MNSSTQRDAFWNTVYNSAKLDRNIVVVTADMGAPALDRIRRDLAGQFVNVGIAEQNAITLAAGLVLTGKNVFTCAIAPFITLRCLEQIRVEGAIMRIPINVVGVGAGFGYEDSGPTHHLVEDIAVMRAFPNITIHSITDNVMAKYVAKKLCTKNTNANYVRLDRKTFPDIYTKDTDFSKGFSVVKQGADAYIFATGCMVHTALDITKQFKKNGVSIGVVDVFTLPIDGKSLAPIVRKMKKIITLEEHFMAGGFGSAIGEFLNDHEINIPFKRLGLPMDRGYCYEYGGRETIREYYGLDKRSLTKKIKEHVSK
jgi:transketolase